jgi:hypothetical protein
MNALLKLTIRLSLAMCGLAVLTACDPSSSDPGYLRDVGGPRKERRDAGPHHQLPSIPDDTSYWEGDGVAGSPLIRIRLAAQRAYFYKGGTLVGVSIISTGKEGADTPNGNYRITEMIKDHRSSIYGHIVEKGTGRVIQYDIDIRKEKIPPGAEFKGAPMPNFMRFNGAVGMHTGNLPGYAASHGCVRLPHYMSEKFFANAKVGTPVIVE